MNQVVYISYVISIIIFFIVLYSIRIFSKNADLLKEYNIFGRLKILLFLPHDMFLPKEELSRLASIKTKILRVHMLFYLVVILCLWADRTSHIALINEQEKFIESLKRQLK